jgi:hypothetical protein
VSFIRFVGYLNPPLFIPHVTPNCRSLQRAPEPERNEIVDDNTGRDAHRGVA